VVELTMTKRPLSLLFAVAALAACDERSNPTLAHTPVPALVAPTGHYVLTAVNDTLLPHTTTFVLASYCTLTVDPFVCVSAIC
jgi:hypothetical protein